ncbi:unnamed protein product [Sphagnum troendelagicum]|uniref:Uncharacterized protein n=1 Tax=Sphagnum troendelagicum TaxID=128251 RepID=A0ABP0U642_9BRYO
MEERFRFFENRLALLEGRINTLENENVSLLGKVNQQAVVHSFVADALIEERNLTAHFNFGERGRRVSDCRYLFRRFPQLKSQLPHQANIIELFGGPRETTLKKTKFPAVTEVGQHLERGQLKFRSVSVGCNKQPSFKN